MHEPSSDLQLVTGDAFTSIPTKEHHGLPRGHGWSLLGVHVDVVRALLTWHIQDGGAQDLMATDRKIIHVLPSENW